MSVKADRERMMAMAQRWLKLAGQAQVRGGTLQFPPSILLRNSCASSNTKQKTTSARALADSETFQPFQSIVGEGSRRQHAVRFKSRGSAVCAFFKLFQSRLITS